jgi:hypothetical protein
MGREGKGSGFFLGVQNMDIVHCEREEISSDLKFYGLYLYRLV